MTRLRSTSLLALAGLAFAGKATSALAAFDDVPVPEGGAPLGLWTIVFLFVGMMFLWALVMVLMAVMMQNFARAKSDEVDVDGPTQLEKTWDRLAINELNEKEVEAKEREAEGLKTARTGRAPRR